LEAVFLTHLHADHTGDLAGMLLYPWGVRVGRTRRAGLQRENHRRQRRPAQIAPWRDHLEGRAVHLITARNGRLMLLAVRWQTAVRPAYRDVAELLAKRGVTVANRHEDPSRHDLLRSS